MKKLFLILFFVPVLLFAQNKEGVLKIDLDSTILYTDMGVVFEFAAKQLPDSIRNLCCHADTIICTDFKTLTYKNKIYYFDITKAIKKVLKTHWATIYFKGNLIKEYITQRKHKIKKYDYYIYTSAKINQVFLELVIYQRHHCITHKLNF